MLGDEILGIFGGGFGVAGIAIAKFGKLFLVSLPSVDLPSNLRLGQFERRERTEARGLQQSLGGRLFRGGGETGAPVSTCVQ